MSSTQEQSFLTRHFFGNDDQPLVMCLLSLTIGTGLIDAFCICNIGHVFVGNMTGNIVYLGMSMSPGYEQTPTFSIISFIFYAIGAGIAGMILRHIKSSTTKSIITVSMEIVCVTAAIIIWYHHEHLLHARQYTVAVLGLSMGLRTVILGTWNIAHLPVTVLTRTITGLFSQPVKRLVTARQIISIIAMGGGGFLGTILSAHQPLMCLILYAILLIIPISYQAYYMYRHNQNPKDNRETV